MELFLWMSVAMFVGVAIGGWYGFWYGRHVEMERQIDELEAAIAATEAILDEHRNHL